jgi:hypothetical protein
MTPSANPELNVLLEAHEVRAALSDLCIKLGFCLPPPEIDRMAASPPRSIDEFSRAVFIAEGLDPATSDKHLFKHIREIVMRAFVAHQSKVR